MVKERKPQLGTSNLSARSQITTDSEISVPKPVTKFFRSPSHKLLAPEEYKVIANHTNERTITDMSTWGTSESMKRDFQTVHKSTYKDPRSQLTSSGGLPKHKTEKEVDQEIALEAKRDLAATKYHTLTKNMYGTTASMFKLVIKRFSHRKFHRIIYLFFFLFFCTVVQKEARRGPFNI
jgi:hypothetical protein